MRVSRKLQALNKRKDFLKNRIAANRGQDLTFDKSEHNALCWAISVLNKVKDREDLGHLLLSTD